MRAIKELWEEEEICKVNNGWREGKIRMKGKIIGGMVTAKMRGGEKG